jgi:L-ascorbate metabolism protein UlaG (beta-lactamase superfamily)
MIIHQLRNATMVIETTGHHILVDPMLGGKGSIPPFSFFRFRPKRNPLVELPKNSDEILHRVTFCLITHCHTFGRKALSHQDHLDQAGIDFLKKRGIPIICRSQDGDFIKKLGLTVSDALAYGEPQPFCGGEIIAIPARHGHGWIHHLMANGAGFVLRLPGEPSLYILGDTVYTTEVRKAVEQYRPDILVVAAGGAQLDIGGPILMQLDEIVEVIQHAPKMVIANHLEALNHCPINRKQLYDRLKNEGLLEKAAIPLDGETIRIDEH